jgi:Zn-dependent protease with chaperone function
MHVPAGAASRYTPRDPETFFQAQRKARRATWRMSGLAVVAALLMGLPLTLILTPLFYAFALIVADLVELVSPLPQQFWQTATTAASFVVVAFNAIANQKPIEPVDPQVLAAGVAIILAPGIVIALLMWMGVHAFFRHGGVGGALLRLQAREPNRSDLKELQLADVAQEMAIAAGIPAPKLMLTDAGGANAAVVGTSAYDARIVISRAMLDALDRQQLEAVLGTLISSVANGDLRIAFTVSSVFETAGLIATLIGAPFARESRQALWKILRYAFRRRAAGEAQEGERAAEADVIASLLSGNIDPDSADGFDQRATGFRKLVRVVFFPFIFTNLAVRFTLWIFLDAALGPCMALVWRARRYLADASAIELTRNPDTLASAIEQLAAADTGMPGGEWATHLFLMDPRGDSSVPKARPNAAEIQKIRQAWLASGHSAETAGNDLALFMEFRQTMVAAARGDAAARQRIQAFQRAVPESRQWDLAEGANAGQGTSSQATTTRSLQQQCMISFHAPLKRRLRRLARMGAHVTEFRTSRGGAIAMGIFWVLFSPLLVVIAAMMLFLVGLMLMMNLFFLGLWLAAIHFALTAMKH